jgi:hypothetical protein
MSIQSSAQIRDQAQNLASTSKGAYYGERIIEQYKPAIKLARSGEYAQGQVFANVHPSFLQDYGFVIRPEGQLVCLGTFMNRGTCILPAHEVIGEPIAARDGLTIDLYAKLTAGGSLKLLAGRVERDERIIEIKENCFNHRVMCILPNCGKMSTDSVYHSQAKDCKG